MTRATGVGVTGLGSVPMIPMLIGTGLLWLLWTDPAWGAQLSLIFPLSFLLAVMPRYRGLLDYRIVYLFSITVWSFNHCYGVALLAQNSGALLQQYNGALTMYGYGVVLSTMLVLLFWKDKVGVGDPRQKAMKRKAGRESKTGALRLLFFIVVSLAYAVIVQLESSDIPLASVLGSFMVVTFATIQASYAQRGRWGLVALMCIYTSAVFSSSAANRTTMLAPIAITCLAALAAVPRLNWRVISGRTAVLLALVAAISLLADWQKQMGMSLITAMTSDTRGLPGIGAAAENSNYFAHSDATADYLRYLQYIIDHHLYHNGSWFMQLVSSFTPRALFPNKPIYDVSAILYDDKIVGMPMYFDFLFDRISDSGMYGILLYNLGYLCLTRGVYRIYSRVRQARPYGLECGLYLTSLVTLFLVMRGPIILIAWFYLFPMTAIVMRNIVMRIFRFTWQKRPVRGRSSNRLRPEGRVYISAATVVAGNRERRLLASPAADRGASRRLDSEGH